MSGLPIRADWFAEMGPEWTFAGCDPTIADRADCERFGVHGDAAAHGFARLRDGGALDLRHVLMPVGAISQRRDEERIVLPLTPGTERLLLDGERFVGLHAIYASPEDVRRLCCGEDETITTASHGFAGVSPTGRRCTLAIGGHDEHEDLATGVKWSARPNPLEHLRARAAAFVSQPVCADCDKPAEIELLARCGAQQRLLKRCGCGEKVITVADRDVAALPSPAIEWRNGSASLGQSQAHVLRDGDVYRWQVNHLGLRIRDGVESRTFDAHAAAGRILFAVHEATPSIEWLAKFFGLLFRIHDSTPAAMRAKQEAPLVALVAAVPEGLDPIGWRAAVLGTMEQLRKIDYDGAEIRWRLTDERPGKTGSVERLIREEVYSLPLRLYQRAITPAAPVDRVRATWKTRGPVLPCDNGWDE